MDIYSSDINTEMDMGPSERKEEERIKTFSSEMRRHLDLDLRPTLVSADEYLASNATEEKELDEFEFVSFAEDYVSATRSFSTLKAAVSAARVNSVFSVPVKMQPATNIVATATKSTEKETTSLERGVVYVGVVVALTKTNFSVLVDGEVRAVVFNLRFHPALGDLKAPCSDFVALGDRVALTAVPRKASKTLPERWAAEFCWIGKRPSPWPTPAPPPAQTQPASNAAQASANQETEQMLEHPVQPVQNVPSGGAMLTALEQCAQPPQPLKKAVPVQEQQEVKNSTAVLNLPVQEAAKSPLLPLLSLNVQIPPEELKHTVQNSQLVGATQTGQKTRQHSASQSVATTSVLRCNVVYAGVVSSVAATAFVAVVRGVRAVVYSQYFEPTYGRPTMRCDAFVRHGDTVHLTLVPRMPGKHFRERWAAEFCWLPAAMEEPGPASIPDAAEETMPLPKKPVPKKVPSAKVPPAKVPAAKVPAAKVPPAKVPPANVPAAKVPTAKVPTAKVPHSKVPAAKAPVPKAPVPKAPIPNGAAKAPSPNVSASKVASVERTWLVLDCGVSLPTHKLRLHGFPLTACPDLTRLLREDDAVWLVPGMEAGPIGPLPPKDPLAGPIGWLGSPPPDATPPDAPLFAHAETALLVWLTTRGADRDLILEILASVPRPPVQYEDWEVAGNFSEDELDFLSDTHRQAKEKAAKSTPASVAKSKPAATKPAASKPAATKPAASKPAATKPAASKPAATKPAATKPAASKPAATKPAASKPAAAKPAAAKPAAAKQAAAKPAAAKQAATTGSKPAAAKQAATTGSKPATEHPSSAPRPVLVSRHTQTDANDCCTCAASLLVAPMPSLLVAPTPSLLVAPTPSLLVAPTPLLLVAPTPSPMQAPMQSPNPALIPAQATMSAPQEPLTMWQRMMWEWHA